MAETGRRSERRPVSFALSLLVALLVGGSPAAAQEKCDLDPVKLQPVPLARAPFAIDVPADWTLKTTEFSNGAQVEDRDGNCRVEVFSERGSLDTVATARLYEGLYLGENSLDRSCADKVVERISWTEDALAGEYRTRARRQWVLAIFGKAGGETVWMFLKCKGKADASPPWRAAASIFASFRLVERAAESQSQEGSGLFGPLYFFLNRPMKRPQNPTSGVR